MTHKIFSSIVLATLLGSGLSLTPALAQAQDKKPASGADARRYFNAAQKAFAEGRFVDAARAFEEAFRIKPHPAPLINAGDAWEKAGEYALAARDFDQVLKLEQSSDQDRADAVERLARLQPQLGIIKLEGEKTQRIRIDDEEFHAGESVYVFPGEHQVSLLDVAGAQEHTIEVGGGKRRTVLADTLMPKDDGSEGGQQGDGGGSVGIDTGAKSGISPLAWVGYGVAAVGVAGAVYFGLQVNDAEASFDETHSREDYDRFNDNKLLANIGWGVAVVGAGVGTVFLIQGLGGEDEPAADTARRRTETGLTSLDVAPLPGGGAFVARGRF